MAISLFIFAITLVAQIPEDCADRQQANGWPEYYCDCKYNYQDFTLPLDTVISYESIWLKGWVSDLYDGLSAYLHSDCDLNFEVYASCTAKEPRYKAIFTQNEASAIDGEAIKRKLEENQVGNLDVAFYICISPIGGKGGRLIMRKESDGMPSSCEDPLYMLPGMSLYSTQPNDVYLIDPTELNNLTDIILQWEPNVVASCQLQVTSGTCNGPVIAQDILETDDVYIIPADIIRQAYNDKENLYLHFSHAADKAGMVRCLVPEYEENYIDTLLCQGMGLAVHDTLLTEPTVYTIDTTYAYGNTYMINFYNLEFYEPDIQPDTLAFKYTHQPYIYRGQHTISKPGDYDITIHTSGQCDERYALHVYHDIDTVVNVVDTFLCYGASYEHEGKKYQKNTSFAKTDWKNQDTLILDTLNVYFATTPDIVYDTIMQNQNKYGKTFNQTGDFNFTYTNPLTYCVDSIVLHVKPGSNDGITYDYSYIDTTLCQGMEYEDYYENVYTESTVLYDTIWLIQNEYCEIEITTITFIEPEYLSDTLILAQSELPYIYRDTTIYSYGEYELEYYTAGGCLELAIHLFVQEKKVPTHLDNTELYDRPRLILHDGVVYILRGSEVYTLFGQLVHITQP